MTFVQQECSPSLGVLQEYCNVALDVGVAQEAVDAGPFVGVLV